MALDDDAKETARRGSASLSYRDAGVNIDAGNALIDKLKFITKRTHRPEVLSDLGGFGALCEIPGKYKHPVLVSATDGVGTKLKLAMQMNKHDTIGIDLVAMCVNDLIVCGAEPLFFLDYYATGELKVDTATDVVAGIGKGCELAGCALIGGETAEMPGMYANEDYDLAGFAVGVVEKSKIIKQSQVSIGDSLIGISSSGPHSNGYSLIRKILERSQGSLDQPFDNATLGEVLLKPTRIYVKALASLHSSLSINGIAHITGGGITENLPRVLPEHVQARIELESWQRPIIFDWLQEQGNILSAEMYRTFNCGIGMVLCLSPKDSEQALYLLKEAHHEAAMIGEIVEKKPNQEAVVFI